MDAARRDAPEAGTESGRETVIAGGAANAHDIGAGVVHHGEIVGSQLASDGHQQASVARCGDPCAERRWRHQLAKSGSLLVCRIEQHASHGRRGSRIDDGQGIEARHTIGISVGRSDHASVFCGPISSGSEECRRVRMRGDSSEADFHQPCAGAGVLTRHRRGGRLIDGVAECRRDQTHTANESVDVAEDVERDRAERAAGRILRVDDVRAAIEGGRVIAAGSYAELLGSNRKFQALAGRAV